MTKAMFLLAASLVALSAGSSVAAGRSIKPTGTAMSAGTSKRIRVLYNQNSNDAGSGITSENFSDSSTSAYSDQGADDFVIPTGKTWRITEVDVTGVYFSGYGPAMSESVIFYKNKNGLPRRTVKNGTFMNLNGTGGPDFTIALPGKGLKLDAGHYWVSVVTNMYFLCCGSWAWEVNSRQNEDLSVWQNPNGGYDSCRTWGTVKDCAGSGPDFMFALRGTSQ
jgi:hypothetical protein